MGRATLGVIGVAFLLGIGWSVTRHENASPLPITAAAPSGHAEVAPVMDDVRSGPLPTKDADTAWRRVTSSIACLGSAGSGTVATFVVDRSAGPMRRDPDAEGSPCEHGPLRDWRTIQRELERAARLGSVEARFAYASDPLLLEERRAADVDAWASWREHAPGYLDEAIARGDARAAVLVAITRDPAACDGVSGDPRCRGRPALAWILGPDPGEAFVHYLVARTLGDTSRLVDERLVTLGAQLEPAEVDAAQARAQEILGRARP